MAWQDTAYQKGRKKAQKAAKKEAKKFTKRNKGFVIGLVVCLVLGLALGIGANLVLTRNDEFTLYENNAVYSGEEIKLSSGASYDVNAEGNSVKVVSFGKDLSEYVKTEIKYLKDDESDLVVINDAVFTADGTYYVIYYLDYTGEDTITKLMASKYDQVKLRKTVVIGGETNE